MSKSSKLERTNVVHTIRDMEQFKEEYKKLGENYDYFVTDTLKKALNSKFHHRNIFYLAKEKVFICVSENNRVVEQIQLQWIGHTSTKWRLRTLTN